MKARAVFGALVASAAVALATTAGTALAKYSAASAGGARAIAQSMPTPAAPTTSVSARNVTVSWSAVTLPGGTPMTGYVVRRFDLSGVAQTVGAACSGTVTGVSCTESGVPSGSWKYTVQAKLGTWTGAQSALSATTTVAVGPQLVSLQMKDANGNGKVDQVVATFDTTLATYTAGTTPWTLTNVPSSGTLASVAVSGTTATLTLTEGAGAANTAVGTFTVALATNANGIRDAAGNLSSFAATAPADKAGPAPTAIGNTNGTSNGLPQTGNTVTYTFSENIPSTSFPASTTVTFTDPVGAGNDTMAVAGISNGPGTTGGTGYVTVDGASVVFNATATVSGTVVTVTLGTCASGCSALGQQTSNATYSYVAATTLVDAAGNAPSTVARTVTTRLF